MRARPQGQSDLLDKQVGESRFGRGSRGLAGQELLRGIYAAAGMAAARAALNRFCRWADGVGVPELSRLARTVRVWEAEILAWA